MNGKSPGVLTGLRVVDLSVFMQGPLGSAVLGDLGADVIKIEHSVTGDPMRGAVETTNVGVEVPTWWEICNRNKRGVTLNLKTPEGQAIAHQLIRTADVFVHNLRRKAVDQFRMDYHTLSAIKPHLVYVECTGFGSKGPYAAAAGLDLTAQALGGLMYIASANNRPRDLRGLADAMSATVTAFAAVCGILARERHGIGQHIQTSQLASVMWLQSTNLMTFLLTGREWKPTDRKCARNPLYNVYRCADGKWLTLGCFQADRYWEDLCRAIGAPDLLDQPHYRDLQSREANCVPLVRELDSIFASRSRDEWIEVLLNAEIICAPVNRVSDLPADEQVVANQYLCSYERDEAEMMRLPALPFSLSRTPSSVRRRAPHWGEHTFEVLTELGYSPVDIADFRTHDVV